MYYLDLDKTLDHNPWTYARASSTNSASNCIVNGIISSLHFYFKTVILTHLNKYLKSELPFIL